MEVEPLQSTRAMEVDLGAGLGDDLGGFDALDELFAPSNTPDFFKSSTLDNGTQAAVTAPPSPGSSGTSSSWLGDGEGDFAPDDWNQQVASMRRENVKLESIRAVGALTEPAMHVRNSKPRARKRHDEDEALKAIETAHPSIKRRSSAAPAVVMKVEDLMPSNAAHSTLPPKVPIRRPSIETSSSGNWNSLPLGSTGAESVTVGSGTNAGAFSMPAAQHSSTVPPAGGAIKVKKDEMSVHTRPRISVFMSSSLRHGGNSSKMAAAKVLDSAAGLGRPLKASISALPERSSPHLEPTLSRSSSAQRIKDLRIVVRTRTQAEQHVVKSNPPVVAMGSHHGMGSRPRSAFAMNEGFAHPTLQRANSVGALKIKDVYSRSPVLSPTGSIIESCELSQQMKGGGGQRRNLVCKVFGTGSPFSRRANPAGQ